MHYNFHISVELIVKQNIPYKWQHSTVQLRLGVTASQAAVLSSEPNIYAR
jgi:hypothetical protein